MKTSLLILSAACLIGMSSCDNRVNIQGEWQSSTIKLDLPNTATSTATMSYTFNSDGTVNLASEINITEPLSPVTIDNSNIEPYMASVSATSSISGTWQYAKDENDEVVIIFDDSTFQLNIDPEAVEISVNETTDTEVSTNIDMKAAVVQRYKALLTPEMKATYTKFSRLDDIKVDKNFLNCEIADHDYIFRAVAVPE
ncbi:MAG: hypothetical protein K2J10_06520 [Muribaculaceae bacterium]|nr:hypothetical protein [Muribaculaceae bacterium]